MMTDTERQIHAYRATLERIAEQAAEIPTEDGPSMARRLERIHADARQILEAGPNLKAVNIVQTMAEFPPDHPALTEDEGTGAYGTGGAP